MILTLSLKGQFYSLGFFGDDKTYFILIPNQCEILYLNHYLTQMSETILASLYHQEQLPVALENCWSTYWPFLDFQIHQIVDKKNGTQDCWRGWVNAHESMMTLVSLTEWRRIFRLYTFDSVEVVRHLTDNSKIFGQKVLNGSGCRVGGSNPTRTWNLKSVKIGPDMILSRLTRTLSVWPELPQSTFSNNLIFQNYHKMHYPPVQFNLNPTCTFSNSLSRLTQTRPVFLNRSASPT